MKDKKQNEIDGKKDRHIKFVCQDMPTWRKITCKNMRPNSDEIMRYVFREIIK